MEERERGSWGREEKEVGRGGWACKQFGRKEGSVWSCHSVRQERTSLRSTQSKTKSISSSLSLAPFTCININLDALNPDSTFVQNRVT